MNARQTASRYPDPRTRFCETQQTSVEPYTYRNSLLLPSLICPKSIGLTRGVLNTCSHSHQVLISRGGETHSISSRVVIAPPRRALRLCPSGSHVRQRVTLVRGLKDLWTSKEVYIHEDGRLCSVRNLWNPYSSQLDYCTVIVSRSLVTLSCSLRVLSHRLHDACLPVRLLPHAHVHVIFTLITVLATRAMADPQVSRHQMYALMVLHQISAIVPSVRRGERRARRPNRLRPGQLKEMNIQG